MLLFPASRNSMFEKWERYAAVPCKQKQCVWKVREIWCCYSLQAETMCLKSERDMMLLFPASRNNVFEKWERYDAAVPCKQKQCVWKVREIWCCCSLQAETMCLKSERDMMLLFPASRNSMFEKWERYAAVPCKQKQCVWKEERNDAALPWTQKQCVWK